MYIFQYIIINKVYLYLDTVRILLLCDFKGEAG